MNYNHNKSGRLLTCPILKTEKTVTREQLKKYLRDAFEASQSGSRRGVETNILDAEILLKKIEREMHQVDEVAYRVLEDESETVQPEEEYAAECPACGIGQGVLLGKLGKLTHYRCRNCGVDWHYEPK
jgi:predicted RNA-binding Zn-ribbon protein involved in translation (DUF1610 family)